MQAGKPTTEIRDIRSNYAVIVAGGTGSRMQSALPKQFMLLAGKPVLMHTIEAFYYSTISLRIILVLPSSYHKQWRQLCSAHNFAIDHVIIAGGETRFHSVKNAIDLITDKNVYMTL
jgi:2-C-methyl-D-erythritol 4-phosphate cytidylyltransferase